VLSISTNANGYPFSIVEIEEAATVPRAEEDASASGVAATSYVNFYLANGAVIVPQFGEYRTDEMAVQTMKELFPDRVVETVMLNWMPFAGGGLHCATQPWPLSKGMKNDEGC
jgi:agmatine deiminase